MQTIDHVWELLIKEALIQKKIPSRNGSMKEIIGSSIRLEGIDYSWLTNTVRTLSLEYAHAELLWYLSAEPLGDLILAYAPSYKAYLNEDGVADGHYGQRWANDPGWLEHNFAYDQILGIINELRKFNTRRAVISIWNGRDLGNAIVEDSKDIPCTICYQFVVRENRLTMIVTMRSQDLWLGFPYDVYVNTCIQRLIADALGFMPGAYIHNVGSLHLYEKNWEKATRALDANILNLPHAYKPCHFDFDKDRALAVSIEQNVRIRHELLPSYSVLHPVLNDAVLLCASKWISVDHENIQSKLLQEIVKRANN